MNHKCKLVIRKGYWKAYCKKCSSDATQHWFTTYDYALDYAIKHYMRHNL